LPLFSRIKKTLQVGLALHQDRISMVKLSRSRQINSLEAFAIASFKKDGNEELLHIIKKLVNEMRAENVCVAMALAASNVINKRIRLPSCLTEAEREADIASNLNHYFPGVNESLNVDFVSVDCHKEEDDLLLVAARREQVNAAVTMAEQAKLRVRVIDVDVYAIARAMTSIPAHELIVVLDIDVNVAQLILITHGIVTSVHPIPMSHDHDLLVQQLKRGILLFSTSMPTSKIKEIILTGKRSYFPKIKQLVQDELQMDVSLSHVFKRANLSTSLDSSSLYLHEPELLVAYGLALRSFPRW
jgi:type IV pilus assembly protein PilM